MALGFFALFKRRDSGPERRPPPAKQKQTHLDFFNLRLSWGAKLAHFLFGIDLGRQINFV